ncbi:MAG: hypothetical protein LBV52_05890 [Spirochaetaceae bacterium]|jgi:uncharacterized protein (TIGR03545 family)|nr:hypothetical protein [Spirochaetaceae bacterium]
MEATDLNKKIPGIFKKPIRQDLFQKKVLRYIEQKKDKDFLLNAFELKDGFYILRPLCDTQEDKLSLKKLKSLAKDIKANKALPVNIIPLAAISAAVAGAVIFFTIIMNPLLEGIAESALENVFEAKVDIDRFNLNLLRFRISLESLVIADRDSPMENIFEMRHAEIRLLPQAVLRGKIYIEEIRADSLAFGTPRKKSGALPGIVAKKRAEEKQKTPAPPLIDLQNFDGMALVKQQYDKLQSLKMYNEAFAFYNSSVEKWTGKVESSKKQVEDLKKASEPFVKFDPKSINIKDPASIQAAVKLIEDGKTMLTGVQSAVQESSAMLTDAGSDLNKVNELRKSAQNSVQADLDHLKSFLNFSSGAYKEILDPALQQVITGSAQRYINYANRALEVLEKVKSYQKEQQAAAPKKEVFKGRNVVFPSPAYPKFYLGILASDFTIDQWKTGFDLRGVSSNPDLAGRATNLKLSVEELSGSKKTFAFDGMADFRTNAKDRFNADVTGKNIPFGIKQDWQDFSELGIGGINGEIAFAAHADGKTDKSFGITGSSAVVNPELIDPNGTLALAIDEAVREAGKIDIGFRYAHIASENKNSFDIDTNLFDLILASLKKSVQRYAAKAEAELKKALLAYIDQYIGTQNISEGDLENMFAAIKGDKNAITALQNTLQDKVSEAENKIKGAADEKIDEAKDAAQKMADETRAKAEAAAEEAKLKAQTQADEARKKGEDSAKNAARDAVKNMMNIPGF